MSKLNYKVIIVTGVSKGIGEEIAKQMGVEGANLVLNSASSKDGADTVVAEIIKNGGTAVTIHANLSNSADIKNLFEATTKTTVH